MPKEFRPALQFDEQETLRIKSVSSKTGRSMTTWIRNLILKHAPDLTVADALTVRVTGFERNGWNLVHYADALAYAETALRDVSDIAPYMARYTTAEGGETWIDGRKLPQAGSGGWDGVEARARDLFDAVQYAHKSAMFFDD